MMLKKKSIFFIIYVTLEHKSGHKSLGYICSNSSKYIVSVKIINFSFMPKIIMILRSCSMKIFCQFATINISKLNYLLVICIAKNLIRTTLKMIFSIFRFCLLPQIINSCISVKYCPIINHTSMEILFILMYKSQIHKCDPYDWFCGPWSDIVIKSLNRIVATTD